MYENRELRRFFAQGAWRLLLYGAGRPTADSEPYSLLTENRYFRKAIYSFVDPNALELVPSAVLRPDTLGGQHSM
jgi:hypothetical protein